MKPLNANRNCGEICDEIRAQINADNNTALICAHPRYLRETKAEQKQSFFPRISQINADNNNTASICAHLRYLREIETVQKQFFSRGSRRSTQTVTHEESAPIRAICGNKSRAKAIFFPADHADNDTASICAHPRYLREQKPSRSNLFAHLRYLREQKPNKSNLPRISQMNVEPIRQIYAHPLDPREKR
ncbi:MAG: hypothetical protein MUC38_11995 [Cyclobacteriaceae bacterium]|nr:hypothetical protein [Cyclobacteriaceae bacterium]